MSFLYAEGKTKEEALEKAKRFTSFDIQNSDGIVLKYFIDRDEYERLKKWEEELRRKKRL